MQNQTLASSFFTKKMCAPARKLEKFIKSLAKFGLIFVFNVFNYKP